MNKKNIIIGILIILSLIAFIKKDYLIKNIPDLLFGTQRYNEKVLNITLNTPESSLSAESLSLNDRIRTGNIYEGLLAFDAHLKIMPSLAVSWGNIEKTIWEIELRRGVTFHDQKPFNAESVVEAFNSRESLGNLEGIKEIKIIDDYNIQIITKKADPLLPSRLTKFYISRAGNIGTGPYKLREIVSGKSLSLTAFDGYWGNHPKYRNVEYIVDTSRIQRKRDFEDGNIDILVAVPRDQALTLPKNQLRKSYSLEIGFLMFKMDDQLLSSRKIREIIFNLFDPIEIENIGNNFVRQATQFIAPGVYGYNADIPRFVFDESKTVKDYFGKRKERISLDCVDSYKTLSEYLTIQLRSAGFSVKNNFYSGSELIDRIKNNKSRLFLIGWQAEDGDAGGFLDAFIHSEGEFNGGDYKNWKIDKMIEESREEMNPEKRLQILKEIMVEIDKDLIGVPLFESSRLYGVNKGIKWQPRLDGLVLAKDVK